MKNILVLKHYKLKNISGWVSPNPHYNSKVTDRIEKIQQYEEMKNLCILSAKRFVLGLDDIVVHESEVSDIQHAFRQHFFDLYDLWKQGNINMLYADLDVLFARPFDWFGASSHFVMYNNCNSGIRYHGHDMDPTLWEFAFEKCKSWNTKKWDYEQDIYMAMNQHPVNPEFGKEKLATYNSLVSNLPEYDHPADLYNFNRHFCAVHFHSSKGNIQFERMKQMAEFLKLNEEL